MSKTVIMKIFITFFVFLFLPLLFLSPSASHSLPFSLLISLVVLLLLYLILLHFLHLFFLLLFCCVCARLCMCVNYVCMCISMAHVLCVLRTAWQPSPHLRRPRRHDPTPLCQSLLGDDIYFSDY